VKKINSGLNSDILNPQGFKQMVESSVELYTTEFDRFDDKVLGYFSKGHLSNDTDEPILSGQIATYPIVIGPTINGFGKKAYQGIRLCIQYPKSSRSAGSGTLWADTGPKGTFGSNSCSHEHALCKNHPQAGPDQNRVRGIPRDHLFGSLA
jgi:hypothetical protein